MTTVSSARRTPSRRRLHTAVATLAVAVTAVTTIAVGAREIGVAPPPNEIPMFCPVANQCSQQIPDSADPDAPLAPAAR